MTGPRRRRADANNRPDEIRRSRRDVREGLDWLRKTPPPPAGGAPGAGRGGGGVFSTFVEGTIGGPPDRPTPFRVGTFVIALRTGAPIVPLAVAGTEGLYRGKRFAARIL